MCCHAWLLVDARPSHFTTDSQLVSLSCHWAPFGTLQL